MTLRIPLLLLLLLLKRKRRLGRKEKRKKRREGKENPLGISSKSINASDDDEGEEKRKRTDTEEGKAFAFPPPPPLPNNSTNTNNEFGGIGASSSVLGLPPGMGLTIVPSSEINNNSKNNNISLDLDPSKIFKHLAAKGFGQNTDLLNGLTRQPHENPVVEDHYKRFYDLSGKLQRARVYGPEAERERSRVLHQSTIK